MKKKIKKLRSQLPYLPKTVKLVWKASGRWMTAWGVLLLVSGILPVVIVSLAQPIIDGISHAAGKGMEGLETLIVPLSVLGGVLLLLPLSATLLQWVRRVQAEKVQDAVKMEIQEKAVSLPLSFFEMPYYHDMLYRASIDAQNRPTALLENAGMLVQNSITLTGLLAVMFPIAWWLPPVLLAASLPALAMALGHTLRFHAWRRKHTADERRLRYYEYAVTDSEHAAELRLFDLGSFFTGRYRKLRTKVREGYFSLLRSELLAETAGLLIGFSVLALVMGWMLYGTLEGEISVGALSMFYLAFTQGQRMMRSLLGNVSELYRNMLFLENLFDFLALKAPKAQQGSGPSEREPWEIVFDQVRFCYPHSERPVLDALTLTLPAGKTTAIVGTNGAGKSTLVKLLCRFYDPDGGEIRLNGTPLTEIAPGQLRQRVTALFQNPMRYHMQAGENIALGNIRGPVIMTPSRKPQRRQVRTVSSRSSKRGMKPCSAAGSGERNSAAGSGSVWHWRGHLCGMPGSSCWTNPPALWTHGPRQTGLSVSVPSAAAGRR